MRALRNHADMRKAASFHPSKEVFEASHIYPASEAIRSFHPSKEVFEGLLPIVFGCGLVVSIPLRKFLREPEPLLRGGEGGVSIPLRKFLRRSHTYPARSCFHPSKEVFEGDPISCNLALRSQVSIPLRKFLRWKTCDSSSPSSPRFPSL